MYNSTLVQKFKRIIENVKLKISSLYTSNISIVTWLLRIPKVRVRYLGFHIQHCLGCDVITHRLGHLLEMLGNNGWNAWPFFFLILREIAPWWGECQNFIYSFTVSRPHATAKYQCLKKHPQSISKFSFIIWSWIFTKIQ